MTAKTCSVLLVLCGMISAALARRAESNYDCVSDWTKYHVGDTFPDHDGFQKCTCLKDGVKCNELYRGCHNKIGNFSHGEILRIRRQMETVCTCYDGRLRCNPPLPETTTMLPETTTMEPGSCYIYGRVIKHRETFINYLGVDEKSGFPRIDTCRCKHGEITCRWDKGPCYYRRRYFEHGEHYEFVQDYRTKTCVCRHTKMRCSKVKKPKVKKPKVKKPKYQSL
ncbi:hypothetical protein BsWGS_08705 [Bradybaena similaris]